MHALHPRSQTNQPLTAASNYLSAGQHIAAKLQDDKKNAIIDVMREVRRQVVGVSERIRRIRSLLSKDASVRSLITIFIGHPNPIIHHPPRFPEPTHKNSDKNPNMFLSNL